MSAAPGPVRVRAAGAEQLWVVEEPVERFVAPSQETAVWNWQEVEAVR
jgi:hypothetical protein